ncbi:MAG: CBS domain-containing protein [Candidatus Poribacteria bacterium]|nr:CBS domain-containing protein [Candidatus Poribacteria bacterium]MDE0504281.1 CBS domain-containing protein [Candidatus Poribacteria bacterium]
MDAHMLSLPISTLNPNQPCSVEIGTTVSEAIRLMQDGRFGCVLVVDAEERLVGIVTERDILVEITGTGADPIDVLVDDIMTPDPESLHASDPIAFALNLMHLGHYRHVPLVLSDDDSRGDEGGYPVGVISSKDITNHVAAFLEGSTERR